MSFSEMPLTFAGSNGKAFGECCPPKARAAGMTVAACSSVVHPLAFTSSPLVNVLSAAPAPPAAIMVIARLLENLFIAQPPLQSHCTTPCVRKEICLNVHYLNRCDALDARV